MEDCEELVLELVEVKAFRAELYKGPSALQSNRGAILCASQTPLWLWHPMANASNLDRGYGCDSGEGACQSHGRSCRGGAGTCRSSVLTEVAVDISPQLLAVLRSYLTGGHGTT